MKQELPRGESVTLTRKRRARNQEDRGSEEDPPPYFLVSDLAPLSKTTKEKITRFQKFMITNRLFLLVVIWTLFFFLNLVVIWTYRARLQRNSNIRSTLDDNLGVELFVWAGPVTTQSPRPSRAGGLLSTRTNSGEPADRMERRPEQGGAAQRLTGNAHFAGSAAACSLHFTAGCKPSCNPRHLLSIFSTTFSTRQGNVLAASP